MFGQVVTAMLTPFNDQGKVNLELAGRLAVHLVEQGSDTILLAGTTGESPTLTHYEEAALFKHVVKELKGKAKVMAGTGSNCTATAVKASKIAEDCGVSSLLQVTPYYNKPSQEGMKAHFEAVADAVSLPIMLYNIPGRTSISLDCKTLVSLSQHDQIVAIKEASGSREIVAQLAQNLPQDFLIYSGDDALTLDFLEEGACGVVSVASHLVGPDLQDMITFFKSGNKKAALEIHQRLESLFSVLFITSNPVPLKAAMTLKGFEVGGPRLPLLSASDDEVLAVKRVLQDLSLLND